MKKEIHFLKHFPIDQYVDFVVNRQHTAWNWTQAEQHGKSTNFIKRTTEWEKNGHRRK